MREAERQRQRAEQSDALRAAVFSQHEPRNPNAHERRDGHDQPVAAKKSARRSVAATSHSIRQSSEALLVILNDILDISKIQAGRMELEVDRPVRSRTSSTAMRTTLQFRAEEKGLAFRIRLRPAHSPGTVGDPVRLQQVLLNLAGNAVKFTEKGRVNADSASLLEQNAGTTAVASVLK
jgi:signal transduction histidine kinase